jgi:predicted dehydrogenase
LAAVLNRLVQKCLGDQPKTIPPYSKMNLLESSQPVPHLRLQAPIRLGYVGCGFMAQHVHLPNFSTLPQCALLAVAERRSQLASAVANRFAIEKVYANHLELAADPEIDAVALSANYAQQGEIAADLLRAGKHVFMEKPLAVSVVQAERILNAATAGSARLMVAFMKRFDPGNVLARATIRDWLQDGTKGRLLYARNHGFGGHWLNGLSQAEPFTNSDEPIEAFDSASVLPVWLPRDESTKYIGYLQQYSHNLNLLRFLLEADQQEKTLVESVSLDKDGMTGLAVLHCSGIRCILETASTKFHSWDEQTQIYFEGGWIRITSPRFFAKSEFSAVEIYEAAPIPRYSYPVVTSEHDWNYRAEAAHFIAALIAGEPFGSAGEDALIDVWLNEEIYKRHLRIT